MSREEHARDAVQKLIPDDEILDVALAYPRGFTKSQAIGMSLGGAMGMGSDFQGIGVAIGGVVGGKIFSNLKELPQSFVLAVSPTMVYVLGRDRQGPVGGWDTLQPMVKFERDKLRVDLSQHVAVLYITLVDTEHDASLELEATRLGTLDVKALLEMLRLSDQHLEDHEGASETS